MAAARREKAAMVVFRGPEGPARVVFLGRAAPLRAVFLGLVGASQEPADPAQAGNPGQGAPAPLAMEEQEAPRQQT